MLLRHWIYDIQYAELKNPLRRAGFSVGPQGLEPRTDGLLVRDHALFLLDLQEGCDWKVSTKAETSNFGPNQASTECRLLTLLGISSIMVNR